jgi:hypothetical protein
LILAALTIPGGVLLTLALVISVVLLFGGFLELSGDGFPVYWAVLVSFWAGFTVCALGWLS